MAPTTGHSSNSSTSSAGEKERQYHAANGKPAVAVARHERTPGTPRKESTGRERAVQDPGLRDYRLGECLGKGAFGSVYKAIHWGTGEAVAVKQIKLVNLPKSELRMIEAEIDLLKNLHHDNIVKYIGFVKSTDCLNIILEYCENGSLHSICKAYGKFPENLVGVYMTQVLQGLQYLHDQGVIHRDIKGANILTTKDGKVKLADFGVSTSTLTGPDKEAQVVGTPYWMAPEIIELSGATPASDIWSLGCTVIELLQGKPPYHHLQAMPALFAIVNDDHPPLPEGVSSAARDFLIQCFQKDPNLRVSARKLLKHNWIVGCRRSDAPVAKASANFSQAVEEVKQWNKALTSDTNLRASTGSDSGAQSHQNSRFGASEQGRPIVTTPAKGPLALAKPRPTAEDFRSPELADDDNWDNDFATAISPRALKLPHIKPQDHFGGMLSADRLKLFTSVDYSRDASSNWGNSMDGEMMTIKKMNSFHEEDPLEKTIRPNWKMSAGARPKTAVETKPQQSAKLSPRKRAASGHQRQKSQSKNMVSKFELPSRLDVTYKEQSVEDFSDLFDDNDQNDLFLNQRLVQTKKQPQPQPDTPQLFHPSDLTSLPRSTQSPMGGSMRRQTSLRPSVLPDRQMQRSKSSIEIQKFAEDEGDEDFSDIFGPSDNVTEKADSDRGSEDGGIMVLSKVSNNSWLGDDEDEDDPFASMDPGWDEMDLEANIARDRHARLAEKIEELVRSLKMIVGEDKLTDLAEDLLALLWEHTEVKDLIIGAHGLLPILEILEPCTVKSRQHMILQLLKVVNTIILDDVELQENLCFVGGIPIITKFSARQYSNEIRLEAAAFVRQMYQTSTLTLQMFVSAGGLNVLVEFLDEDYDNSRDLVLIGVNGVWNVFELQGPTPKNDFCRIFSRSKILDPLALVLHRVLDEDDEDELTELIEGRIVNIFYLFSQAENYVKEMVADRQVLKSILKDLRRMSPAHQITMLKFIKNLSMLSTTLETLHSADAIDLLIDLLSGNMKKGHPHFREISNQVLNTMFNLCRLSKDRQEYAAVNGIIPLLMKIMKTDRPPKEFALPILCDMAHSGSKGRRFLWQNKGLDFYVSLLADQYWQVTALDAIFVWLQEETAKVEGHLINGNFTEAIISCFNTQKLNAFDPNLLEPLLKLLRLSPDLSSSLAKSEMFSGIAQKLGHKKAVVRLNLLRLVRNILDARELDYFSSPRNKQLRSLLESIQTLAEKDSAVLVRNLASELVRTHISGDHDAPPTTTSGLSTASVSTIGSNRSRSGPRRIYTPPSLHSASSMPITPTHGHGHRPSHGYIEVASSPKRSAVSITHERDSSIYRPRSRDGPMSSIPRRISGDLTNAPPPGKTRLPRNSGVFARPSLSEPSAARSQSVLSNKENQQGNGTRYPLPSPSASSTAGHSREGSSGKQRRSRAPSESGGKKWAPGS
ncbi:cell division control protein [Pseudomassariella vexata]|uniref:non-specific serine/threonine protein kinase n=1 Tax=Pseudomassariella vexata TaxID=1141098 RepID=A0A1Y2EBB2_9PEZI|nr:cell division control protein [Pseudomassariella vexata]ORY68860.1 cell division control protein [Pseudomassariella vexata]